MPAIKVSDNMHHCLRELSRVVTAVMDEECDFDTCVHITLERGIRSMLNDILSSQDQSTLLESIQQLAAKHPSEVFGYVAETLMNGARLRARQLERPRVGFAGPELAEP